MDLGELVDEIVRRIPDDSARASFQFARRPGVAPGSYPTLPEELEPVLLQAELTIPLIDGYSPLTPEGVMREKKMMDGLLDSGELAVEPGEPDWWKKSWWPFASDLAGQLLCWDQASGQVIEFQHDDPTRDILAATLAEFFGNVLAEIEKGLASWPEYHGWRTQRVQQMVQDYEAQLAARQALPEINAKSGWLFFAFLVGIIITIVIFLWK